MIPQSTDSPSSSRGDVTVVLNVGGNLMAEDDILEKVTGCGSARGCAGGRVERVSAGQVR